MTLPYDRLIDALGQLHNAEIEFIVSRMAQLKESNPNMSPEELAEKGPQIEEELRNFEDSIRSELGRRRINPEEPYKDIEQIVADLLNDLDEFLPDLT